MLSACAAFQLEVCTGMRFPSPPVPTHFKSIPTRSRRHLDPSPPVPMPIAFHPHPSPQIFLCHYKYTNISKL